MTLLKVCGITRAADIAPAVQAGATHLGFVFAPGSPRCVDASTAAALVAQVPADVASVGVFQKQSVEQVRELARAAGLRCVQLHGGFEASAISALQADGFTVIWALAVAPDGTWKAPDTRPDYYLLDTRTKAGFGGTGATFSWHQSERPDAPFFVAGGIGPDNVVQALDALQADGADMSSSLEASAGIKSHDALTRLKAALSQRTRTQG